MIIIGIEHWFYLVLGILATHRVSLMISSESGPARIFRKIRKLPPPKSATKEGLSCQLCVSIWIAALVALFYWRVGLFDWKFWFLWWLGMSSGAILCHMKFTKSVS